MEPGCQLWGLPSGCVWNLLRARQSGAKGPCHPWPEGWTPGQEPISSPVMGTVPSSSGTLANTCSSNLVHQAPSLESEPLKTPPSSRFPCCQPYQL